MHLGWGELADKLGISRSMLDQTRSGVKIFGPKTMRALVDAEIEAGIASPARSLPTALDRLAEEVGKRDALGVPLAELHGKDTELDAALAAATPELRAMARLFSQFAKAGEKRLSAIESELKTLRADLNLKKKPKR